MKDTLTLSQAANYLGIRPWVLKELIYHGEIASRRNQSGTWTIRLVDLDRHSLKLAQKKKER